MKEIKGNIWDYHKEGHWIVITTNGYVKTNSEAVMGAGVALQAKQRFPKLPLELGGHIKKWGNQAFLFPQYRIITMPVKKVWWEKADIKLIETGCEWLAEVVNMNYWTTGVNILNQIRDGSVYLVRPGCGNGQLDWKDVKPILEKYLDDRFIVVEKKL